MVSEEITHEQANQFLGIPGYAVIGDAGDVLTSNTATGYAGSGESGVGLDGVLREPNGAAVILDNGQLYDPKVKFDYNAEGQRIDQDGVVRNAEGNIISRQDDGVLATAATRDGVVDNDGHLYNATAEYPLDADGNRTDPAGIMAVNEQGQRLDENGNVVLDQTDPDLVVVDDANAAKTLRKPVKK